MPSTRGRPGQAFGHEATHEPRGTMLDEPCQPSQNVRFCPPFFSRRWATWSPAGVARAVSVGPGPVPRRRATQGLPGCSDRAEKATRISATKRRTSRPRRASQRADGRGFGPKRRLYVPRQYTQPGHSSRHEDQTMRARRSTTRRSAHRRQPGRPLQPSPHSRVREPGIARSPAPTPAASAEPSLVEVGDQPLQADLPLNTFQTTSAENATSHRASQRAARPRTDAPSPTLAALCTF